MSPLPDRSVVHVRQPLQPRIFGDEPKAASPNMNGSSRPAPVLRRGAPSRSSAIGAAETERLRQPRQTGDRRKAGRVRAADSRRRLEGRAGRARRIRRRRTPDPGMQRRSRGMAAIAARTSSSASGREVQLLSDVIRADAWSPARCNVDCRTPTCGGRARRTPSARRSMPARRR